MANLSNINNKFLVTTGGDVGIGTTSPGSKLVVAGGTDTSYNDGTLKVVGSIALNSANNLNPSLNRWALRPRAAGVEGSFDIYDARHSLSRLTIDDSGNVGIGTDNPDGKLEIASNSSLSSYVTQYTNDADGAELVIRTARGTQAVPVQYNTGDSAGRLLFQAYTSTGSFKDAASIESVMESGNANAYGGLRFNYLPAVSPYTLTEGMRLNMSGNVGIGATSPDAPLEIQNTPAQQSQKMMLHLDANHTGNQGSAYMQISAGSNSQAATRIEQVSSGGSGLFGTYLDTNIINQGQSASAHGNINFVTNQAIRMTIGAGPNAGNVGIGTTSPTEKLHLKSTTNGSFIRFEDNGGSGVYVGARSNDLEFYAGGSEKMVILSGGNVGIGATLPEQKLHVEGRGIFDGGASSDILQIRNDSGGGVFGMTPNLFALDLASTSNFRIRQGSAVPLYLNSNGNLGIGTITPDSKLHVKGISTLEEAGAGSGTQLKLVGQDSSGHFNFLLAKQYNVNNAFEITPSTVANGGVFTNPAFIVNSAGKVGIATTSPSEILTIPGNYGVGLGYKTFYSSGGTVPAGIGPSNYLVATLNQLQGTTLSSYYQYKFFLTTASTGTYNSSVYIVYANSNNTAWLVREVSRRGTSSNHPELTVNGTEARIYNDHPSAYPVIYRVETTYSGQANTAPNIFGADYMWQRTTGVLTYTDGNVGIGTTGPGAKLEVNGDILLTNLKATGNCVIGGTSINSSTLSVQDTKNGTVNSPHFQILGNGYSAYHYLDTTAYNIVTNSTSREIKVIAQNGGVKLAYAATAWVANSDIALKENIKPLENVLDKIKDYKCVEYNLKESPEDKKIGFIAQDWVDDFPAIVNKDEKDMLGMKYTETIPVLLKAIQELKAEIELLKSK